MRYLAWCMAIGLASMIAATAHGQGPADRPSDRAGGFMTQADADGDGKVSWKEAQKAFPNMPKERFDRLDQNDDGVLSPEDRPERRPGRRGESPQGDRPGPAGDRMARLLERADANDDKQVTLEELKAVRPEFPAGMFDRMDRNNDGVLDKADRPKPEDRPARGGPPEDRGHPMLERADKDGDGKVSWEEAKETFPQLSRERFDRMDRNEDGGLGPEDRPERRSGPQGQRPRAERREGAQRGMFRLFQEADANSDNQVTYEELKAVRPEFPAEVFDRMDRNDDGVLDKADRPERPERTRRPGPPGGPPR